MAGGDITKTIRALAQSLREVARELRKADPAKRQSYRLQRIANWLPVTQLPPAEGGKTRIPAPDPALRKRLAALVSAEKWLELIEASEWASGDYIFWLDLHRHSALGMDRSGALFLEARETLGRELVSFLTAYPTIREYKFADGSGFCDHATLSWLDEEVAKWGGGGGKGGGGNTTVTEEDEELAARFEKARELVQGGDLGEGLVLAAALARRGADGRARFRSTLAVARLAMQGSRFDIAEATLVPLVEEIESRGLEAWEPALAASVYASLLSCLQATKDKDKSRSDRLFAKLSRLDPSAAIKLVGVLVPTRGRIPSAVLRKNRAGPPTNLDGEVAGACASRRGRVLYGPHPSKRGR